jgi:flagellar protein FlaF
MSYAAYAGAQKAAESPRDLEISAISYITRQMVEANNPDVEPMTRIRALNGNVRLWTLLMNDLSQPENPLPETLKASYISIGIFARRASVAALSTREDLAPLIGLNTDVLDALAQQRQGGATP